MCCVTCQPACNPTIQHHGFEFYEVEPRSIFPPSRPEVLLGEYHSYQDIYVDDPIYVAGSAKDKIPRLEHCLGLLDPF